MKTLPKSVSFAIIATLAAWQATDFSLESRALIGSVVAGLMGYLNPLSKSVDLTASDPNAEAPAAE